VWKELYTPKKGGEIKINNKFKMAIEKKQWDSTPFYVFYVGFAIFPHASEELNSVALVI
jgi:hypothetical protein